MMDTIPEDVVTAADIAEWYKVDEELGKLKSKEALLRSRIFKAFFKTPTEGTNSVPMNDGTGAVLKADYKVNRTVDVGTLDALKKTQADALAAITAHEEKPNIPLLKLDELIKWKPDLSITHYRKLTAEEQHYFDQCLVIKPGTPSLEVVIPKRAPK